MMYQEDVSDSFNDGEYAGWSIILVRDDKAMIRAIDFLAVKGVLIPLMAFYSIIVVS